MFIVVIIILAIILLAEVAILVKMGIHSSEQKKYYAAARRAVKEMYLNEMIMNKEQGNSPQCRMMLYVKASGQRGGAVYAVENGIKIGRDYSQNDICVRDDRVSSVHCCIFMYQGVPVIKDFDSANGTWIIRRGRSNLVQKTEHLRNDEKLQVGSTVLKLHFFWFDISGL